MKKSDVINRLELVLSNLSNVNISNKTKAQVILEEMEACGMVPPRTLPTSTPEFHTLSDVVVYSWDKE